MQSSELEYKKYLRLISRRKVMFIVVALLIMTFIFLVSYLLPKKYESTSTVFIEKNVISELVKGITITPSMEDTINVLTYAITSRTLLTKVVDSLDLNLQGKSDLESLITQLQKSTKVKVKDKNLFTISFTSDNPRVARDYVNTLVRLYIEQSVSSKRGESYDASKFLTEQIDTFNSKLEKAEKDLNTYKREKGGVISIDEGRLFQEINTAQQKLYDLELRRRQLEGMRQVTKKANDPRQARLSALQKRLADLSVSYTDSYPEVQKVKGDIETIKEQMSNGQGREEEPQSLDPKELAKIDSEVAAIKVTESGLHRYISSNKSLLQNIPTAKAGLDKLELEKKNQKNIYDQLFARQGQSEVSKQMEVQDKSTTFRVVDPAVLPTKPSSPDRLKIMLMGVVLSLAGSYGLLLLLEQLDRSVKEVNFVKELGVPVLAIIPRMTDPALEAQQRRRLLRIFAVAGLYFLVLLCFPAMEFLGFRYVDRFIDNLHPNEMVQGVKGLLR